MSVEPLSQARSTLILDGVVTDGGSVLTDLGVEEAASSDGGTIEYR